MTDKHLLFTSSHCKHCPQMRQNMLNSGVPFEAVSVDSQEGSMRAATFHIRSLPSLLIYRNGLPYKVMQGVLTPGQIIEAVG